MKHLLKAFGFAGKGIVLGFKFERNMKLHGFAAIIVIILGFYCHVSALEWIALLICIGGVFSAELVNTAIEKLTDMVSPEYNPKAGAVKDTAAGAVLITAIVSLVVGAIIFIPKIF